MIAAERAPDWQVVRQLRPKRHPDVSVEAAEDHLLLRRELAANRSFWGKMSAIAASGRLKTYELEGVGLFVWDRIDGARNCESLAQSLRSEYKLGRQESEVALVQFLRTLAERGLIILEAKRK